MGNGTETLRERGFWLEILKEEIENLSLPDIKNLIAFIRA